MSLVENRIKKEIKEFDLLPLVEALEKIGYQFEDIYFRSNREAHSPISIVEDLEFSKEEKRVYVTVNTGLFGSNSILPSYFQEFAESLSDDEHFFKFFGFLDHLLIRNYFFAIYPERDERLFHKWEEVRNNYFQMLGINSANVLHWLFSKSFSDFKVKVDKLFFDHSDQAMSFRVGENFLDGGAIIGNSVRFSSPGFVVNLYSVDELAEDGLAIKKLVINRIRKNLISFLLPHDFYLKIELHCLFDKKSAKADGQSFLGSDSIGVKESGHYRKFVIFEGQSKKIKEV